jgi:threonine dehydrogenase-like Zn-dependent dehydrogenase
MTLQSNQMSRPPKIVQRAIQTLAKARTLAIIGVYPPNDMSFPIGIAVNKNLTIRMGNTNHRKYIPHPLELVRSGTSEPCTILTKQKPMASVIDAYKAFNTRQAGRVKVELRP